jgi:hypothetical protein
MSGRPAMKRSAQRETCGRTFNQEDGKQGGQAEAWYAFCQDRTSKECEAHLHYEADPFSHVRG